MSEISQRMRVLARLLIKLKELRKDVKGGLIQWIKPEHFDATCACKKDLAGHEVHNEDGERLSCFTTPSLPLKIVYALDSVASLVHGYGLRQNDDSIVKSANGFQQLYQHEWSIKISSASLRILEDNKFNRFDILPVTADLMKLKCFPLC